MNKKSITILVVCLIVTVLSVSLAYYSARIIGNGKNVSVNAKELTINFDNNNEIASGIIEPGWSSANTFSITNKSKTNFTYDIVLKNYKNTTKTNGYLVYKITSTNGYNMTEYKDMPKDGDNTYDLVIARGITIEPGSSNKQSYTLEIKYLDSTEDQSIDMGSTVTGSLYIVESTTNENNPYTKGTLGYQIMEDNSNVKTRTDFSKVYEDINIGTMYKAQEDNTDVYYFSGDARNNWVKFGTFAKDIIVYRGYNTGYSYLAFKEYDTLEECNNGTYDFKSNCTQYKYASAGDPMYWRIVRTNADGSIKLLYAGTSPDTTEGYIGVSGFYPTSSTDPMYAGYMYGTSGSLENNRLNTNDSTIKTFIDNWYTKSLVNYNKYLSTSAVYCNDRTLVEGGTYSVSSPTNFAGSERMLNNTPTYNCANIKDAFSVDNTEAKLTYPIALLTADEVAYAGAKYGKAISKTVPWFDSNSKGIEIVDNYHGNGSFNPLLMTPYTSSATEKTVNFFTLTNTNSSTLRVGSSYVPEAVRPVISLKSDVLYKSGDGSASSPYEIQETPDTLSERLLSDKSTRPGERTYFKGGFISNNTKTLYTGTEDGTTVYYFAGNATDNWVKFGGYYWRIIRTNSDGGVRLLYHGTSTTTKNAYIGGAKFNSSNNDVAYVSYMYGKSGSIANARTDQVNDSSIKNLIDNWYASNMTSYTKYLSTTAVYCSDRTRSTSDPQYFGMYDRYNVTKPTYDCSVIEDKFTVDSSTGNGKLTYPIALMTADEAIFAGGRFDYNSPTWYYYNSEYGSSTGTGEWWLMSPNAWNGSLAIVHKMLASENPGRVYGERVTTSLLVRPVVSLKSDVVYKSGDGTPESPYEIVTD